MPPDFHNRHALVDNGGFISEFIKNTNDSFLQLYKQRMDTFPNNKEHFAALERGSHFIIQTRDYLILELYKYLEVTLFFIRLYVKKLYLI